MMSMDLENEVMAIWIQLMGSRINEERLSKRGSPDFINLFSLEAHLGEATGNIYVRPKPNRHCQG